MLFDNIIVIPITVVEELDNLKKINAQVAVNARLFSRAIDEYRSAGSFVDGVKTKNDGMLFVDCNGFDRNVLDHGLRDIADNRILMVAMNWQAKENKKKSRKRVILLSKDVNLRIKANALGIEANDWNKDKLVSNVGDMYSGVINARVDDPTGENYEAWRKLSAHEGVTVEQMGGLGIFRDQPIYPNMCCRIFIGDKYCRAIYKAGAGLFLPVPKVHKEINLAQDTRKVKEVLPINDEQAFLLALVADPTIKILTVSGIAGTGKTLMLMKGGFDGLELNGGNYKRMLVWRPMEPLGREMGFLPGTVEEKFSPFVKPMMHNLSLVVHKGEKADQKNDYLDDLLDTAVLK